MKGRADIPDVGAAALRLHQAADTAAKLQVDEAFDEYFAACEHMVETLLTAEAGSVQVVVKALRKCADAVEKEFV